MYDILNVDPLPHDDVCIDSCIDNDDDNIHTDSKVIDSVNNCLMPLQDSLLIDSTRVECADALKTVDSHVNSVSSAAESDAAHVECADVLKPVACYDTSLQASRNAVHSISVLTGSHAPDSDFQPSQPGDYKQDIVLNDSLIDKSQIMPTPAKMPSASEARNKPKVLYCEDCQDYFSDRETLILKKTPKVTSITKCSVHTSYFPIPSVANIGQTPTFVEMIVGNARILSLADTGAGISVISHNAMARLSSSHVQVLPLDLGFIQGVNSTLQKIYKKLRVRFELNNVPYIHDFYVCNIKYDSILGKINGVY